VRAQNRDYCYSLAIEYRLAGNRCPSGWARAGRVGWIR